MIRISPKRILIERSDQAEIKAATNEPLIQPEPPPAVVEKQQDRFNDLLARTRNADPWSRSNEQRKALLALLAETIKPNYVARQRLVEELERQVPYLRQWSMVQSGDAKMVTKLIISGSGPLGIKTMNDHLIGFEQNAGQLVPRSQALLSQILHSLPLREGELLEIGEQNYKETTIISNIEDQERLDTLTHEALTQFDWHMLILLKRTFKRGIERWQNVLATAREGSPEAVEAQTRITNITRTLRNLPKEMDDTWRYPVHFGSASVTGEGHEDLIAASLNASKSALMSRAIGETRGGTFDLKSFIGFIDRTMELRQEIIDAGNRISLPEATYTVFLGESLVPNRALARRLRKGRPEMGTDEDRRKQCEVLRSYLAHLNSLDYIKTYSSNELGQLPIRIDAAREMVDRLQSGKPIEIDELLTMLQQTVCGSLVPELGKASEAFFFNRSLKHDHRLLVHADIKDLGLDQLEALAQAMDSLAREAEEGELTDQELFRISVSASDAVVLKRRSAYRDVWVIYDQFRQKLLEQKPKAEVKSKEESAPLMLLGGDEVTLSLHPDFEPFLPEICGQIARALSARVAVVRKRGRPKNHFDARKQYRKSMTAAEWAIGLLKTTEAKHRGLRRLLEAVEDPDQKVQLYKAVADIELDRLYCQVEDDLSVGVRRYGTGTPATSPLEAAHNAREAILEAMRVKQ